MKDVTTGTEQNYQDRESGQSSTSKYIQANTPPTKGDSYGENKIAGTPDDKTLTPNLKNATVVTKSIEIPTLAALLGVAIPFVKTSNKKEIKEPPPTSDKAQYGKVQVKDNNGFVEIQDNTPKNKRWVHLHPTGTYNEVRDNGDLTEKNVHDRITVIINDWNITINGDLLEVIDGNNKIQIKRDRQTNINGNDNLNIDGNSTTNVGKNLGLQVGGDNVEAIQGNMVSEISGKLTEDIKKDHKHTVNGSEFNTVMGNRTDVVAKNFTVAVTGNTIVHVGGNANVSVDGKTHLLSKGGVDIDGGSGAMSGSVTKMCVCPLVHGPHIDASTNVRESK